MQYSNGPELPADLLTGDVVAKISRQFRYVQETNRLIHGNLTVACKEAARLHTGARDVWLQYAQCHIDLEKHAQMLKTGTTDGIGWLTGHLFVPRNPGFTPTIPVVFNPRASAAFQAEVKDGWKPIHGATVMRITIDSDNRQSITAFQPIRDTDASDFECHDYPPAPAATFALTG